MKRAGILGVALIVSGLMAGSAAAKVPGGKYTGKAAEFGRTNVVKVKHDRLAGVSFGGTYANCVDPKGEPFIDVVSFYLSSQTDPQYNRIEAGSRHFDRNERFKVAWTHPAETQKNRYLIWGRNDGGKRIDLNYRVTGDCDVDGSFVVRRSAG